LARREYSALIALRRSCLPEQRSQLPTAPQFPEEADKASLPVFIISFPGAHSFYHPLGFKDVGHFDADINE